MQQLAAAVIKDDGISDPVRALAAIGSGGSSWRNCARDYTRFLASRLKFPSLVLPYQIDIPIPKLEGLGTEVKPAFVMLPHEVFSTLYAEWPSQFSRNMLYAQGLSILGDGTSTPCTPTTCCSNYTS